MYLIVRKRLFFAPFGASRMQRWKNACCASLLLLAACSESGPGTADGAAAPVHPGKATYERFCFSCHAAGIAGAPKTGDADAWAPRLARGMDQMLQSTVDGMPPGMPARGLCFDCSDEQLTDAIDYMLVQNR